MFGKPHTLSMSVIAVVTALAGTGCGGDRASDAPITSERDLQDVCERRTYFTRAPAAAASPPRPIVVFEQRQHDFYSRELILQAGPDWQSVNPNRYQVVACSKRTGEGEKIKDCAFDTGVKSVPLHEATFEVTLYEAKTRKPRKTVSIRGKDYTCPTLRFFRAGEDLRIFSNPKPNQYVAALGDEVQR